jgi:cell division protein FtsL
MDQFTLIAILVVLLVVALIVVSSGLRRWVFRILNIESRVEGHQTVTKIRASDSRVHDVSNREGLIDIEARHGADIKTVGNEKK